MTAKDTSRTRYADLSRDAANLISEIDVDLGTDEMRERIHAIAREVPDLRSLSRDQRAVLKQFRAAVKAWESRRRARLQREQDAQNVADAARLVEVRQRFHALGVLSLADVKFLIHQVEFGWEATADDVADGVEKLLASEPSRPGGAP